jgi:hypothetical protein
MSARNAQKNCVWKGSSTTSNTKFARTNFRKKSNITAHHVQRHLATKLICCITFSKTFATKKPRLPKPQKALRFPQFHQQHLGSERAVGMFRPTRKKLVLRNVGLLRRYGTQMMRQQPWYRLDFLLTLTNSKKNGSNFKLQFINFIKTLRQITKDPAERGLRKSL